MDRVKTVLPPVPERFKRQSLQSKTEESLRDVPKITNETVAEHRENVLRGARKFKYPLEHSKHMIVKISATLLGLALVSFFAYTMLSLYKFQTTSEFMYRVTQIVPFPVAKAGGDYVAYENYLFEIRRYMHYYETQQKVDFSAESGKQQLETYKPQALKRVINDAYVKQLAEKHKVTVGNAEVDAAMQNLRVQNQLGNDNRELAAVTQKFFDWSLTDLERRLEAELLAQKVAAKLDTETRAEADSVLVQAKGGADFGVLAAQFSDDAATKTNAGQYTDTGITSASQGVPPIVVSTLQTMQVGQVSDIIVTPTSFEIVKLLSNEGGKMKAAHIEFKYRAVQDFISPLEKSKPSKKYITVQDIPVAPLP
jgi:parvulin-like peptidyl-prolyl isomerase